MLVFSIVVSLLLVMSCAAASGSSSSRMYDEYVHQYGETVLELNRLMEILQQNPQDTVARARIEYILKSKKGQALLMHQPDILKKAEEREANRG